jgi:hypothetical protein
VTIVLWKLFWGGVLLGRVSRFTVFRGVQVAHRIVHHMLLSALRVALLPHSILRESSHDHLTWNSVLSVKNVFISCCLQS